MEICHSVARPALLPCAANAAPQRRKLMERFSTLMRRRGADSFRSGEAFRNGGPHQREHERRECPSKPMLRLGFDLRSGSTAASRTWISAEFFASSIRATSYCFGEQFVELLVAIQVTQQTQIVEPFPARVGRSRMAAVEPASLPAARSSAPHRIEPPLCPVQFRDHLPPQSCASLRSVFPWRTSVLLAEPSSRHRRPWSSTLTSLPAETVTRRPQPG